MTKAVMETTADLASIAMAVGGRKVATFAADIGLPFHPGATRFYKGHGINVM